MPLVIGLLLRWLALALRRGLSATARQDRPLLFIDRAALQWHRHPKWVGFHSGDRPRVQKCTSRSKDNNSNPLRTRRLHHHLRQDDKQHRSLNNKFGQAVLPMGSGLGV